MDRPNWKFVLPAAAAGGFVLVGFWGLLAGPLGTAWFLSWRRKRDVSGGTADDEDARLAVFMAEVAKAQMAAAARKPTNAARPGAGDATPPAVPAAGTTATPAIVSNGPRVSFAELRQRVRQMEERALCSALAAARLVELERAGDAHAAVEAALIAGRAAAKPEHAALRMRAVSRALAACLEGGQHAMAAALFNEFIAERAALRLAQEHWEPLGRALLGQGALMEAAWALHAGAVIGKDLLGAQKRLVEVAGRAADAGKPKVALKLYATLLEKYPDSQYADFVRSNMRVEEKKLAKGSAPA
jgi:hypothetical protein